MLRALGLAGGLAVGAAGAQFPEYSQQYAQRLAGAVDELSGFVAEFDADARGLGLSRQAALEGLAEGGDMGAARAETMGAVIARHARLSADLEALRGAGPFTRAYRAAHLTEPEIARAALSDFKPALPLTFEGAVFALFGFLAGLGFIRALGAVPRWPFRRRGTA